MASVFFSVLGEVKNYMFKSFHVSDAYRKVDLGNSLLSRPSADQRTFSRLVTLYHILTDRSMHTLMAVTFSSPFFLYLASGSWQFWDEVARLSTFLLMSSIE